MKALTGCQRQVLAFIKRHLAENNYPPTVRDVSTHFKISTKAAYDHIKALERKRIIRIDGNRARAIGLLAGNDEEQQDTHVNIPLIGEVAAGAPLFAEENYERTIKLPVDLVGSGKHFALRVCGDSMHNAGIFDGDIAIVRYQNTADNGQIVVALIDGAVTLKRYFREGYRIRLEAENPAFSPIFTQNAQLLGRLSHILRSYVS